MTVNIKPNKRLITVLVALASVGIILIGTFAWTSFNQRARNVFEGFIQPEANLHDDFWEPNKDVYVENPGDAPIYVRVDFKEFMRINSNSLYAGSTFEEADTWQTHYDPATPCPVDNCGLEFHKYYAWIMGQTGSDPNKGWKWYIPASDDARAKYDAEGKYIDGSSKTVYGIDYTATDADGKIKPKAQVSSKGKTYAEITTAMASDNTYKGLLATFSAATAGARETARVALETYAFNTYGVKISQTTANVMTMADWKANGTKAGDFWVMDTDGWFYWANAVQPGNATGLLLSEVSMRNKPSSDWFYGIDVYLNAVTEDDFNALGSLGVTPDALNLLYIATGKYINSGRTVDVVASGGTTIKNTIWYKDLGQNVYEEGTIVTNSNGSTNWQSNGIFNAGSTGSAFDTANFIQLTADGWQTAQHNIFGFNPTATSLGTDAVGGTLNFSGTDYTINSIIKGIADGIYYFNLGDGVYARALSTSESVVMSSGTTPLQGTGKLGMGPHQLVWIPAGSQIGDKTAMTTNPWKTTNITAGAGKAVFYHMGSGVYYKVENAGSTTAADGELMRYPGESADRPRLYAFAGDKAAMNMATDTSAFVEVGKYYTKADNGAYTTSTQQTANAFQVIDIVLSPNNNKYYIKTDDGSTNGSGEPIYMYFAMGDTVLGNANDIRQWAGSSGIGSRDDSATKPSVMPKTIAVGGTFNGLGKFWQTTTSTASAPTEAITWQVMAINGSKALVVSDKTLNTMAFASTGSVTWGDSPARTWLNTTFVDQAFNITGIGTGIAKNQIALTKVYTGKVKSSSGYTIPNPGTNYIRKDADAVATNGGYTYDYVFLLSYDEYNSLPASTKVTNGTNYASISKNPAAYSQYQWLRNRYDASSINVAYSSGGMNYWPGNQYSFGLRPAMWIEFDQSMWGKYGAGGTGGNWTQNNANPQSKTIWTP